MENLNQKPNQVEDESVISEEMDIFKQDNIEEITNLQRRKFIKNLLIVSIGATVFPLIDCQPSFAQQKILGFISSQILPGFLQDMTSQLGYLAIGQFQEIVSRTSANEELKNRLLEEDQFRRDFQQQELQQRRELVELMIDAMYQLQDQQIQIKLKEIQSEWDLQNWSGILSRQETEDILLQEQTGLLILLSPPEISPDCPSSFQNNLKIELQSLEGFVNANYPKQSQKRGVKFYRDYFKKPIGSITVEQLHKILSPIPTAVIRCGITDEKCIFSIGLWGLQDGQNQNQVYQVSMQPWNWEKAKQALIAEGNEEIKALRIIRDSIVTAHQLLIAYLADFYYLIFNPYYKLKLPSFASKFAQAGFESKSIEPFIKQLQDIQQEEQQIYERELARLLDETNIQKKAEKWRLVNTLTGHSNSVFSIAFSPDGQVLASGSGDKTIKLWNWKTGEVLRTLTGHSNIVDSVAFSPDGYTLASGYRDGVIEIWNLKLLTITDSNLVISVAFSPDGQVLVSGSGDKTIKLWNWKTGQLLRTLTGHSDWVRSIAFSPDGQVLASGSEDKTIKLWNWKTGQLLRTLTGHSDVVLSIAFSPDGQVLASSSENKTIKLWNWKTAQILRTLTGHSDVVRSIAFSPDEQVLASGSKDKTIKLWNWKTGQLLRTLTGHSNSVFSIAFSPDGKTLASGEQGLTKQIYIWQCD